MKSLRWSAVGVAIVTVVASLATACRPTFVVVPGPEHDTVYDTVEVDRFGARAPRIQRVPVGVDTVFRVDTVLRVDTVRVSVNVGRTQVDTVVRVDTVRIPVRGGRARVDTVVRLDTVVRVDTVRIPVQSPPNGRPRVDTVVRVDTVRIPVQGRPTGRPRVDTIVRLDTVRLVEVDTVVRTDTVRLATTDTLRLTSTDTVRLTSTDTVRVTAVDTVMRVDTIRVATVDTLLRVDTLRVVRVDTVRQVVTDTVVVPGRRLLFVPPGHYPPEGQCRVWVHGQPPGQQAGAVACDQVGDVPEGAFVLFRGDAWDIEYDWVAEAERAPGSVPAEIVAVRRKNDS